MGHLAIDRQQILQDLVFCFFVMSLAFLLGIFSFCSGFGLWLGLGFGLGFGARLVLGLCLGFGLSF